MLTRRLLSRNRLSKGDKGEVDFENKNANDQYGKWNLEIELLLLHCTGTSPLER